MGLSRAVLAVLFAAMTFTAAAPFAAQATHGPIQPGDAVTSSVGLCTLNFVYDGTGALAGRVFIGTAAHCVSGVGERVSHENVGPFGTVAFLGDEAESETDYAFIEVDDAHLDKVRAGVAGHPTFPTGTAMPKETNLGDPLLFSGWGLGYQLTPLTRQNRVGVLTYQDAEVFRGEGMDINGDSGGPVIHFTTGEALGVVSRLVVGCCANGGYGAWSEGPTVQGILADAAAQGFTVDMRTVS